MREISSQQIFTVARGAVLFLLITIFVSIMILNNGHFIYTLDDPYIHLAVSEEIWHGGYGINHGEYASPSSSILFPLLLAVATPSLVHQYLPLLLNILALFVTFEILRVFFLRAGFNSNRQATVIAAIFTAAIVVAFNLLGLVFSGMEQSIQIAATAATILGLIVFLEERRLTWWFVAGIIIAPLVRYESLALSIAAILCIAFCGRWSAAVGMIATIIITVGSFSLFLVMHGLPPLPSSVLTKSSLAATGVDSSSRIIGSMLRNFADSLNEPIGLLLALAGVVGLTLMWRDWQSRRVSTDTCLAFTLSALTLGQVTMGRIGWFGRYEIYAVLGAGLILVYLARTLIGKALATKIGRSTVLVGGLALLVTVGSNYLWKTALVPKASNNIYEQQYQMHRFLTEYFRQDVAVNDIGWTSYRNDNYVLDLWGLGSEQARLAVPKGDLRVLDHLVQQRQIKLAIIYKTAFTNFPPTWVHLAEMDLSRSRITVGDSEVDFYATKPEYAEQIKELLKSFAHDVPARVRLKMLAPA
jgi:hypothetical protein